MPVYILQVKILNTVIGIKVNMFTVHLTFIVVFTCINMSLIGLLITVVCIPATVSFYTIHLFPIARPFTAINRSELSCFLIL